MTRLSDGETVRRSLEPPGSPEQSPLAAVFALYVFAASDTHAKFNRHSNSIRQVQNAVFSPLDVKENLSAPGKGTVSCNEDCPLFSYLET